MIIFNYRVERKERARNRKVDFRHNNEAKVILMIKFLIVFFSH